MRHDKTGKYVMSFASLAEYRLRPLSAVSVALGRQLSIYSGVKPYDISIRTLRSSDFEFTELRNTWLPGDILLQNVPWRRLVGADALMLDLNPRIPHVWAITIIRRLLRRRTILWGHAWPRSGRGARSEVVRNILRSLADELVAYTEQQARELAVVHPRKRILCAPNSLYWRSEIRYSDETDRDCVVYVGRMHQNKKPTLLLNAFALLADEIPYLRLVLVGDGPELDELKRTAAAMGIGSRVTFTGHVSDRGALAEIYDRTVVAVSPGYAGLSITQAFSFGVPMIISEDEPHAPEYEAATPGVNCLLFATNDAASLAEAISCVYAEREVWRRRGAEIARACADEYSVERMADGLVQSLRG